MKAQDFPACMKRDATGRLVEFGKFPQLETRRLILRELTLDDADFRFRHFSDPEIVELTAFDAPQGIEGAREELLTYAIRIFQDNKGIRWGIVPKGEDRLVGTLGYHRWINEGGYHARMGYDLAASHRRKGIMTEAMTAALDYGFGAMGLNRVEVLTDPRNEASKALVRRLGFRQEGVLREDTFFHGRFLDDVCFSLLAREWRARR